jgi:hypothetical protein
MDNADIPLILERACDGDKNAASLFFRDFCDVLWQVPERNVSENYSGVLYPNELYGFFALNVSDHVIVPIFSSEDFATSWAGRIISCRNVTGRHILQTLPDEWWVGINPGQDIEKELSPWETSLLKLGSPEAIKELVHELYDLPTVREIATSSPDPQEYASLCASLNDYAIKQPAILKLFLKERIAEDMDGDRVEELYVGVSLDGELLGKMHLSAEKIHDEVRRIAEIAQIGSIRVKVFSGIWDTASIALLSFVDCLPFYQRYTSNAIK